MICLTLLHVFLPEPKYLRSYNGWLPLQYSSEGHIARTVSVHFSADMLVDVSVEMCQNLILKTDTDDEKHLRCLL